MSVLRGRGVFAPNRAARGLCYVLKMPVTDTVPANDRGGRGRLESENNTKPHITKGGNPMKYKMNLGGSTLIVDVPQPVIVIT